MRRYFRSLAGVEFCARIGKPDKPANRDRLEQQLAIRTDAKPCLTRARLYLRPITRSKERGTCVPGAFYVPNKHHDARAIRREPIRFKA